MVGRGTGFRRRMVRWAAAWLFGLAGSAGVGEAGGDGDFREGWPWGAWAEAQFAIRPPTIRTDATRRNMVSLWSGMSSTGPGDLE